jgi:hypothetical protein
MHGSIVNVPTNLNLVQIVLFWLSCDDCSITIFLKRKSKYKSIYMLGYVHPNMMMKTLQELCQTPMYKIAKFSIRWNWQNSMELANVNESVDLKKNVIDESIQQI